MRILVTGATGLLGRAVVARLAPEHDVVAVRRPGGASPQGMGNVRWAEADLGAGDLPPEGPLDAIVHLAASRRHRDFPAGAAEVLEVSAGATVRLLEHATRCGADRLVLGSSGAVYAPGPATLREDDSLAPPSFYGECKLAAERLAARFAPAVATIALRFFFIYGPGQHPSMFLPALATRIRAGHPVRLSGPDGLRTNPIHVTDAAAAVVAALESDATGPCNVAGPQVVTLRQLAEAVGAAVGRVPVFQPEPAGGDLVAALDRMRACLHEPRVGVLEAVRDALG